jgi:hypothetical protein
LSIFDFLRANILRFFKEMKQRILSYRQIRPVIRLELVEKSHCIDLANCGQILVDLGQEPKKRRSRETLGAMSQQLPKLLNSLNRTLEYKNKGGVNQITQAAGGFGAEGEIRNY